MHRILLSKGRRILPQVPYLLKTLRLVFSSAPGWTMLWAILLIGQGLLPVALVTLMRRLVDSLVGLSGAGLSFGTLRPGLVWLGLTALVMALTQLFSSATQWIRTGQAERVQDHIADLIHEKSVAVDLAFYDSSEYFDQLHRARIEGSYRPMALLDSLAGLMQNGITVLAMLAVLLPYGTWVPVAALIGVLPAFFILLRQAVKEYRWRLRTTPDERRAWYYYALITDRHSAAEIRLFQLGSFFRQRYRALRDRLRGERLQFTRNQAFAEVASGLLGLLVTGALMGWMVMRLFRGSASLGDLVLFYQVFSRGQGSLSSVLSSVRGLYTNSLFLSGLYDFLGLEPKVKSPAHPKPLPCPIQGGFRFVNVSFSYPGSERPALSQFDLSIPAGSMTAIVGPNGAGKSTLVKLLCRFYDPREGRVELDGVDLRELSLEEIRGGMTVLFQDPVRYNATVRENIAPGRSEPVEEALLERAALAAGLKGLIERLPKGYDTMLGKMFEGGLDLSAGEWLRIALARAFFRETSVIVFDEPTSIMDPWAESDWIKRFKDLTRGRTSLLITHRFTTARHADIIHVMDQGRVVESGSLQELVAGHGLFAKAWQAQALGGPAE